MSDRIVEIEERIKYDYAYPNRTLCSVLDDMRKAVETLNFSYMKGLIEEAQYLADKMEAALADQKDIRKLSEDRSALKKEVKLLTKQVEQLKESLEQDEV